MLVSFVFNFSPHFLIKLHSYIVGLHMTLSFASSYHFSRFSLTTYKYPSILGLVYFMASFNPQVSHILFAADARVTNIPGSWSIEYVCPMSRTVYTNRRVKLFSKISVGPIRWIVFLHKLDNRGKWVWTLPVFPEPFTGKTWNCQ